MAEHCDDATALHDLVHCSLCTWHNEFDGNKSEEDIRQRRM